MIVRATFLDEIWYTTSDIEIVKIQDGGGRHLENRFFGHKSSSDFSEILYEEAERHADKG